MDNSSHIYSDGSKYKGEMKDGKRHGRGIFIRPDGMKYEGEWENDKPNGQGVLTYPNGERRVGEWKDGKYINGIFTTQGKTNEQLESENLKLKRENQNLKQDMDDLKNRLSQLEQQTPQPNPISLNVEEDVKLLATDDNKERKVRKKPKLWWALAIVLLVFSVIIYTISSSSIIFPGNLEELSQDDALEEVIDVSEETKEEAVEASGEMYKSGLQAFEDEDYKAAIENFTKVLSIDPNYDKAIEYIAEAREIITNNIINEVERMHASGEYVEAEILITENREYTRGNVKVNELLSTTKELIKEQEIKEFKDSCNQYEFRVLDKDAERLAGEPIVLRGQVLQIMETTGFADIRLAVTETSYGWSVNDVVYLTHLGNTSIYTDDIITAYGNISDFHTYESVAGYNITLPHVVMLYYEK